MTHKERMLTVIAGRKPDRVPVHHLQFSAHAARVILGREALVGGAYMQWREMAALWEGPEAHAAFLEQSRADAVAVAEACGHDLLRLGYWRWREKPTRKIDEFTYLFGNPEGAWYTQTYRPDIELLVREDGGGVPVGASDDIDEEWMQRRVDAEEKLTSEYSPHSQGFAALAAEYQRYPEYLLKLGGETVYVGLEDQRELMAVALWPELYARLLMAKAKRYAREVELMAAAGMQVNFSGWDFCSNQGPSISPDTFQHVVLPALKHLVDACHHCGVKYFYSSDGNFWPVADDMFNRAGVDGWFEVDKSAGMDLRTLRQKFPNVTLIGNIPVQILHTGTLDDVRRETLDCLAAAHDCGRIVVGCSNMIMPGTPPENILLMLRLIEQNR